MMSESFDQLIIMIDIDEFHIFTSENFIIDVFAVVIEISVAVAAVVVVVVVVFKNEIDTFHFSIEI